MRISKVQKADQKSVATPMPTAMQSMNTTHIKNLKNPITLSRNTTAKPTEDTTHHKAFQLSSTVQMLTNLVQPLTCNTVKIIHTTAGTRCRGNPEEDALKK